MAMPGLLSLPLFGLFLFAPLGVSAAQQQSPAPATPSSAAKSLPMADLRGQLPVVGHAQVGAGKVAVCAACHGPHGAGIAPNFPNLAGQAATYLYVQLRDFKDGHRGDPVMSGQAAPLSDEDMRDIASYYATLAPKTAGAADVDSKGRELFLSGDSARGIPACQGCHGADGQGPRPYLGGAPQPPWSTYPRLRGQSVLYLSKALHDFSSGARSGNSNAKVMQGVARTLSDDDIQVLSTYLSTL